MSLDPRTLRALADAPVVVHRHGQGRYSVAVVVEGGTGYLTEDEAREALARWQALLGGWVTKRDAATMLGISSKMVDVLRQQGRIDARNVNGRVRVMLKSIQTELRRRKELTAADSE